jgi:ubiquinone/menaquinone biosynthesis C-methylase UbiE
LTFPKEDPVTTEQRTTSESSIHDEVRAKYAEAARVAALGRSDAEAQAGCCTPAGTAVFGELLYSQDDRAGLPDAAVLASLGCGNPTAVAELHEGERVLDLGSGGGIDVILSARRVGPTGHAVGLDMTDEMLELARRNSAEAGVTNVEFVRGTIEDMPLPSSSVDVVISNCVINLAADKAAVFREIARVLRPGGRIGVSDVLADNFLSPEDRAERGSFVGCIAGALSFDEYRLGLAAVGMVDVEITPTHAVCDGLYSAIVRATKPAIARPADDVPAMPDLPRPSLQIAGQAACCGGGGCC